MFPDRSLISNKDWCHCCVVHDLAYWRGGTEKDRENADWQLRDCVLQSTRNGGLADLMYAGVRAGGGPYFYTSYRWGYGWPYGRGYQPLSPSEQTSAAVLQASYVKDHPTLACPSQ